MTLCQAEIHLIPRLGVPSHSQCFRACPRPPFCFPYAMDPNSMSSRAQQSWENYWTWQLMIKSHARSHQKRYVSCREPRSARRGCTQAKTQTGTLDQSWRALDDQRSIQLPHWHYVINLRQTVHFCKTWLLSLGSADVIQGWLKSSV